MRIALFTDTFAPQINGVARTLARWLEHALARGHDVALVAPRMPGQPPPGSSLAIQLPSVPLPFYRELRLAVPLDPWSARQLHTFSPQLVHVATEFTVGGSGVAWAQGQRVPLVTSFHTDFPAYLAGYRLGGLERAAWRWLRSFHAPASITLCPSTATAAQLRENGFHARLRLWGRGVDASLFSPHRRSRGVRETVAPGASRILLYTGRLAPEKRLPLLLDAFRRVHAARPDTALVIVGDGPSAADLRQRAGPGVRFTGYLTGEALSAVYAAADVFVFPSDTETFGNVVLEAMASGVPVLAVARGGVVDTVEPRRNGLLAPPGDPAAFAAAALELLGDEPLRRRLAAGARATALRLSWDRILDGVLDTYAELLSRHDRRVA